MTWSGRCKMHIGGSPGLDLYLDDKLIIIKARSRLEVIMIASLAGVWSY